MKKATFLLSLVSIFNISILSAQSAASKIKTEEIQIFNCSNSLIHFREDRNDNQFVRFVHLYNDFLENKKTFYLPDGRIEKIEKYYQFIKPSTQTYSYDYSFEGKKEIVSIKKDNVLETRTIKDKDKDEIIKEVFADGRLRYKIFSVLSTDETTRAIEYNNDGKVIYDEQQGQGDITKANYTKKQLENGNTQVSYSDGNSFTVEVYDKNNERIAYSSFTNFVQFDEFINYNMAQIHLAKPVMNLKPQGYYNFFGVITEIMGEKKNQKQTTYAEYHKNNVVYRTPEETEIRTYNRNGDLIEFVNKSGERELYTYNEKNQPVEIKYLSSEGVLTMKIIYSYKNDLLTKIKVLDGTESQGVMQLDLDYTFDSRGNWTKMTYSENGTCKHVKLRTLTYY